MKKTIIIIAGIACMLIFGRCSDDFLNTVPTDSTSTGTIIATTDNAKYAVNGLAKLMTRQWAGTQGYNGEGTIKLYFGEYLSDAYHTPRTGWTAHMTLKDLNNYTTLYMYYPWAYYYMILGNANSIIAQIDDASGPEWERQYIRAQALSYRAYCLLMLTQIYGNRWADSQGSGRGIVLRLDPAQDNSLPLSNLGEVYLQIYEDLDEAIGLFQTSGYNRRDEFFEIDVNVAYAIYARAAITRQDYSTAADMASKARAGYALMSTSEYESGFCNPNSEWIWGSWGATDEPLHFYSYFAYIAYNSTASAVRNNPGMISRELYNKIPETDIRKGLFARPLDDSEFNTTTGEAANTSPLAIRTREAFPDIQSDAKVFAYMQLKIKANDMPGVGHLNHIRSSEMVLIEAEAQYFLNNPTGAQNLMNQLVRDSGRDPEYVCTQTGSDLLEEIKFYRKIELWGEGFNFFDLKRWNDPLVRHDYENGGNFPVTLAVTVQPNESFKWTAYIPYREIAYNDELDDSVNN